MTRLAVQRCDVCGWHGFPLRLWCARCGSFELANVEAEHGVVEAVTVVRHAAGRPDAAPVRLATVRLEQGPRVVARVEEAEVGDRVAVRLDGGALSGDRM